MVNANSSKTKFRGMGMRRWARVHGERLAGLGKKGRRRIEVEVEAVLVVLIARVEFMKFERLRKIVEGILINRSIFC